MFRTIDITDLGPSRGREPLSGEQRFVLPEDPDRYCSVRVLIPGKRSAELVRMRWNGKEWLFSDGLRLSHANLVLGWSYL